MDFERALKYLEQFVSYEKLATFKYDEEGFNLQRVRNFLEIFNVDYSNIKFVHVAGSKGKGSISNMTAQYLLKIGKKTGLYTSPHILSIRERFQIDGEQISEDLFAIYVAELKAFIDVNGDFGLTYFELLTVLALKYFVDSSVDFAVMEVGMGGRLDATNIISPVVTVLSTVELEHVGVLGDTLEKIVDEKLGIMKEGVPLVVGEQSREALDILESKLSGRDFVYFVDMDYVKNTDLRYKTGAVVYQVLELLLGGVDDGVFEYLVENFKLIGRFDVRNVDGKLIVFDMAHTPASIEMLINSLKNNFKKKKFVVLLSVLKDKQVQKIMDLLSKIASEIVFTVAHEERGIGETEFKQIPTSFSGEINFKADCEQAFMELFEGLKKDQVLVVTGSHFLVAKIFSLIKLC